jgi:deoxyribodipyrimidine photo-lyase
MEIVWFKRDLRVHDHAPLAAACASGRAVLPLYIVEPELWAQPDASGRQFAFLVESLTDLDRSLTARSGRLVVRMGDAMQILHDLHAAHGITGILADEAGMLRFRLTVHRGFSSQPAQSATWLRYTRTWLARLVPQ